MAEEITVARPYAEAVFALAQEQNALARWSEVLAFTAAVASDAQMGALIGNPKLTLAEQERAFFSVCEGQLDDSAKNLMRLLLENRRLRLLPAVRTLFEALKSAQEGVLEANIVTAFPLQDAETKDIVNRLEKRFKRRIQPSVQVDPELLGGLRIVVGDVVFDASVRGQLQKMAFTLKR